MSGLDATSAVLYTLSSLELGVAAEALQAQLNLGDIIAATILTPQNGQDRIEIGGQTLVAQLPLNVYPGQTLLLQVTGLRGNQILVTNLGPPDPQNPVAVVTFAPGSPSQAVPSGQNAPTPPIPQQQMPTAAPPPLPGAQPAQASAQLAQGGQQPAPSMPAASPISISPPREVFVAASVRQAPVPAPSSSIPAQPAPATVVIQSVEARIAAAQTAKIPPPTGTPPPQTVTRPVPTPASVPVPARGAAVPLPRQVIAPASARAPIAAQNLTAQRSPVQNILQRAVLTVSEFLRSANLPDTPLTRAAASSAQQAPVRLPSVLQRLEAALPRVTQDERIPTLRTIVGFITRLSPSNAQTLAAQISSYVSNVIEGAETKLAQLLQAHAQSAPPQVPGEVPSETPSEMPSQSAAQTQSTSVLGNGPPAAHPPASAQGALSSVVAQARVAERSTALSYDLKSVVLSLLRDPPMQTTPALTQALNEALVALTGTQINTLSSTTQNPNTIPLMLPVYYHEGGKPAQLRISRDTDSAANRIDANNFHVAFVLDTANLGTVAIDMQSSGRAVKIDVKTEKPAAAQRFSDTLATLRTRLEDLRYRVTSAAASALPTPSAVKQDEATQNQTRDDRGLDLRA